MGSWQPQALIPTNLTTMAAHCCHAAVDLNSVPLIDALIAAGADPRRSDRNGVRPAEYAAASGNLSWSMYYFQITTEITHALLWRSGRNYLALQ